MDFYLIILLVFLPFATAIPLKFRVLEELPANTEIGFIPAGYELSDGFGYFRVDSTTGRLTTAKVIDREVLPRDKFELVLVDKRKSGFPIVASVEIVDINDNSPQFPSPWVNLIFLETDNIGQRVLLDPASDADSVAFGLIKDYVILSGNEDGRFRLIVTEASSVTPKHHFLHIENTGILDRETVDNYVLNISATDNGNPSKSGHFILNITVGDVNDESPIFAPSEYFVTVQENAAAGTAILKVQATDNDGPGDNSRIIYSITNASQFSIDDAGIIRTARNKTECPRNRNKCDQKHCPRTCVITVDARDCGQPFLTGRSYVYITLLDENDHIPEITFRHYPSSSAHATVAENAPNGTIVAVVSVRDLDDGENGQVTISITGGNYGNHFRLERMEQLSSSAASHIQLAYLKVNAQLNRDSMSAYNLTVNAVDAGHPSLNSSKSLMVIVNAQNDHSPVFTAAKYESRICEDAPMGSYVAAVSATDADGPGMNGRVLYSFVSGNARGWFKINSETGLITTAAPLDRESAGLIKLNVSARDSAPSPRITYAALEIIIDDANDQSPRFVNCPAELELREDMPVGTLVHQFSATDADVDAPNNQVLFSLQATRGYELFAIDSSTGRLTTQAPLDREQSPRIQLKITAKDLGNPSLAAICLTSIRLLDINDNRPVFSSLYYPVILENNRLAAGHKITQVKAADADESDAVRFAIVHSSRNEISLDSRTGEVTASQDVLVALGEMIRVQIMAYDSRGLSSGSPATVLIFRPEPSGEFAFASKEIGYKFSVLENTPSPVTLGSVRLVNHERWSGAEYFITEGDPLGIFTISASSGTLTVGRPLDREEAGFYRLKVAAWLSPYFASTTITVAVEDANEAPLISEFQSEMDIPRSLALGQEMFMIDAHDADSAANAVLTYSLSADKHAMFAVNRSTGSVYLRRPIDADIDTVDIGVQVSDAANLTASKSLRINFIPPSCATFPRGIVKKLFVSEDVPVNSRLFTLPTPKCQKHGIQFEVTDGNEAGHFAVFPDGQLYLNATLDHRHTAYYKLTITAFNNQQTAQSTVTIHVTASNRDAPRFSNQTYFFSIDENMSPRTPIGQVSAEIHEGQNGLRYSINGTAQRFFTIDPQTGVVLSRTSFDAENAGDLPKTFEVYATSGDRTSSAEIHFTLNDLNDNSPKFSQSRYVVSLSEKTAIGSEVAQVEAVDADSGLNGQVRYKMEPATDASQVFIIDAMTGMIRLNQSLNYERRSYDLVIFATDQPADDALQRVSWAQLTVVVLDAGDEMKDDLFLGKNSRTVPVPENLPAGSFISQMSVVAPDDEVECIIADGNSENTFRITKYDCQLYLNFQLDYEKVKFHNLTIVAQGIDRPEFSSSAFVTINVEDVNDCAPSFSELTKSTVRISEKALPGTVVAVADAHDLDYGANGVIRYSLKYSEPMNGHFSIDELTGRITTLAALDREKWNTYRLVIQATDQAPVVEDRLSTEKSITIIINDENDCDPRFTNPKTVIVPEYANSGHRLFTTSATDPDLDQNGQVTFDLTRNSDIERFQLDRYDGHVYLRSDIRSIAPHYSINILARDSGLESQSSSTTVDLIVASRVNTEPLEFSERVYEWTVAEDAESGTFVGAVSARQMGFQSVEYFLTGATKKNGDQIFCPFDIERRSGKLHVSSPLDIEQYGPTIFLQVYAGVRQVSSYDVIAAQIKLEIVPKNNHAPVLLSPFYRFRIDDSVVVGSKIGEVAAKDVDGDELSYWISPEEAAQHFELEKHSGNLLVREVPSNTTKICFVIHASDSLFEAEVNCCVDSVVKHTLVPRFHQTSYAVRIILDYVEDGAQVASAVALGTLDQQLEYEQADDWYDDRFQVDKRTGVIYCKESASLRLSPLEGSTYVLKVEAIPIGHPELKSHALIQINAEWRASSNRFAPPVVVQLSEDTAVGTCFIDLFQQRLYPKSAGMNFDVYITGNLVNTFRASLQGQLCLNRLLDREWISSFNLTVTFASGPYRTSYPVFVEVMDVNDNPPQFLNLPSAITVSSAVTLGTEVFRVDVQDTDSGDNGEVQFAFAEPSDEFAIDILTGAIRVAAALDVRRRTEHQLTVLAIDRGFPAFTATGTCLITVSNGNMMPPRFSRKEFVAKLPENSTIGSTILTVEVENKLNEDARFWISGGNGEEIFSMDAISGELFLSRKLDFERTSRHELTVIVADGSASGNDTARIIIEVENVNDENPEFHAKFLNISVMENFFEASLTRILRVEATDVDAFPFNIVKFFMQTGDKDLFDVDKDSGWISLKRPLDREAQSSHQLQIQAVNAGASRSDTAIVHITIVDANDNAPTAQQRFEFQVRENCRLGTSVGRVTANDADLNTKLTFSIGNSSIFRIDSSSGQIFTATEMDRERVPSYELEVKISDGVHMTNAMVKITVEDEDDNFPVFTTSSVEKLISPYLVEGAFVYGCSATDADEDGSQKLRYRLVQDSSYVVVDESTGVVTLAKAASELPPSFSVVVQAVDPAGHKASMTLIVVKADNSVKFPVPKATQQYFRLPESQKPMHLTTISSESEDVIYSIAAGNVNGTFAVNARTGDLVLMKKLDYEFVNNYNLWIEAAAQNQKYASSVLVKIDVINENDNSPIFTKSFYSTVVDEETIQSDFVKVVAVDADGDSVTYSLRNGTDNFAINSKTGDLSIIRKLDREATPLIFIEVQASDGVNLGSAIIQVVLRDRNDNPPRFTKQFTANVTENAPVGSLVLKVTASDADTSENANITYSLTGSTASLFSVDAFSGEIRTAAAIDYKDLPEIPLAIFARDGSWQTKTLAMISVVPENNSPPRFPFPLYRMHFVNCSKQLSVGQVAAVDIDDEMASQFSYSFARPTALFTIERSTGIISLKKPLCGRLESVYHLTMWATENTQEGFSTETKVDVYPIPENFRAPPFQQNRYYMEVTQSEKSVEPILALKLRYDAGVPPLYRTISSNVSGCLILNNMTGELSANGACQLGIYSVQIAAYYQRIVAYSVTEVVINVTDSPQESPNFMGSNFVVTVPESAAVGSVVFVVPLDRSIEAGEVTFTLRNPSSSFQIDSISGALKLKKQLDFEKIQKVPVVILMSSVKFGSVEKSTSLLVIVQNENDNPPIFLESQYFAEVPESDRIGDYVLTVTAVDADHSQAPVFYIIEPENPFFVIDSDSGEITTQRPLDFESSQSHSFTVRALDPEDPSLFSEVIVTVGVLERNEEEPTCLTGSTTFSVPVTAPAGSRIGMVMGVDSDAGLSGIINYQLIGPSVAFAINQSSGELFTNRDVLPLGENKLHVLLWNPGTYRDQISSICDISVHVLEGVEVPYFAQREYFAKIREDAEIGRSVLKVTSLTDIRHLRYVLKSGDDLGQFGIDSRTGEIRVVRSLDREAIDEYTLEVMAVADGSPGGSSTALVHIRVEDVNDNDPYFENGIPTGHLRENTEYEVAIMKLNATDKDLGPHSFTYRLVSPEWKDYFKVSSVSGLVTSLRPVDREKASEVNLKISVTDSGSPPRSAVVDAKVIIDDVNDQPSQARPLTIVLHVNEASAGRTQFIGNIRPIDLDQVGKYSCEILGGNTENFIIKEGCDLYLVDSMPKEVSRMRIRGNDGKHEPVEYEIIVKPITIAANIGDHSVAIEFLNITAAEILEHHYIRLTQAIFAVFEKRGSAILYGLTDVGSSSILRVAVRKDADYLPKNDILHVLTGHLDELSRKSGLSVGQLDYSPCKAQDSCPFDNKCEDLIQMVPHQTTLTSSSKLIIVGPQFEYGHQCTCPSCENDCPIGFCQNGGSCSGNRNNGKKSINAAKCLCPPGFYGSQCQFDLDECNMWGLPNCYNGGKCTNTFGSFRCDCPAGYHGKQCELESNTFTDTSNSDLGFSDGSYLEIGYMGGESMHIALEVSTTSEDGVLAFVEGFSHSGASNFVAVELRRGFVYFSFGASARDTTRVMVNKRVTGNGWFRIEAEKLQNVGSLSVSNCDRDFCQPCSPSDESCSTTAVGIVGSQNSSNQSLFIGGLSAGYKVDPVRLNSQSFLGCMRNVRVNGNPVEDLTVRNSVNIANHCPIKTGICRFDPCGENDLCVDLPDGKFQCVVLTPTATDSVVVAMSVLGVLMAFGIICTILLFYYRRQLFGKRKTSGSLRYARPPFLSPVNLLDERCASSVYGKPVENIYGASQHYYCAIPGQRGDISTLLRRPHVYGTTRPTSNIYASYGVYGNDHYSAQMKRMLVASPCCVSDGQRSSASTQPVDVLSAGSPDGGHVKSRSVAESDICSDCENCKSRSQYWIGISDCQDQPTYEEVRDVRISSRHVLV